MFRVAIAGAGIGAQHLDGFAALPDGFEIRTLCDLDPARGGTLAKEYQADFTDDLNSVLADPKIDILDICLPPHLHFPTAIAALDAGKAVICEKPLVGSLAEADRLARHAEATSGQVFPVFQYRYGPGMAGLLALIEAGLAGRCYAATLETHWNRGADYYAVPWRGTWAGEKGGALLGHAIHIHDLLTAILGPVERVFADTATRVNPIETEDCAALALRMADGTPVTSSVTLGAADDTSRLRFLFEGFTVESDHAPYAPAARPWTVTARSPTQQATLDRVLADLGPQPPGYAGLFAQIFNALQGKPHKAVTLEDGCRSLEFVTAVYASARSGQPVHLPLGPAHPLYQGWTPAT